MRWLLVLASLLGCGDRDDSQNDGSVAAECTAENEHVQGAALEVTPVYINSLLALDCSNRLFVQASDVMDAFPNGDAPALVAQADFMIDRIVLASSNPILRFAIDDGAHVVVGAEPVCQGAAPSCVAYIIHGTTRNLLEVAACPYRGPSPCLAP